ncbi:thermonuclease family protein [Bradyrhizobium sp. UFLA03-84]|uniref:thermonuclease family protein n=1 Tax=Bradyrhizobium sp. UFLA03-84 TaxID=418599 RepID=UPI0032DF81D3
MAIPWRSTAPASGWGIDAPESKQSCRDEDSLPYRCGAKAANNPDAFIAQRPVSCAPVSLDPYGRTVAACTVGGVDLGEWLVREGFALDWAHYSHGRHSTPQRDAERAGRGIWAGSYVAPWLCRACMRAGGKSDKYLKTLERVKGIEPSYSAWKSSNFRNDF